MIFTTILIGVVVLFVYLYLWANNDEKYWKKRNVVYHNVGKNLLGIHWKYMKGNQPMFQIVSEILKLYPSAPAIGVASVKNPLLIVADQENIKSVLFKDFKSFTDHPAEPGKHDILADNIIFMKGIRWRLTRQKLSPLFTSTKLRNMHYIMDKSTQDFIDFLKQNPGDNNNFDKLSLVCCAAITASIFGITTKSTLDSPLLTMAQNAIKSGFVSNLKEALNGIAPKLFRLLRLKLFGSYEKEFVGAMKQILRERERDNDNIKRHDFADLATTIQKEGVIIDESTGYQLDPTDEMLAAQAYFLLVAGVDPSSTGLFFTLLELSRNPKIQKRVQYEIDAVFESKSGANIDFDDITKPSYLDNVLEEALRMYPPIPFLLRECSQSTVLPVGNIKVEKDTELWISIYDIHRDPKLFPNPNVFDPDRFVNLKNYNVIPFGVGGRSCLGSRFAKIQMKTLLMHILRNFNVTTSDVNAEVKYQKIFVALRPTDDVNFKFEVRENKSISASNEAKQT